MSSRTGRSTQRLAALLALLAVVTTVLTLVGLPQPFRNALAEPTVLLALVLVVVVPLLALDRIDRRDPKLVAAPAHAEPELVFGPVHRPQDDDPGGADA